MIIDNMLQALPGKTHVQSNANIGGVDPTKYGHQTIPGKRQALLLTTEGSTVPGGYPAFMWYPATPRPVLGDLSKLELRMTYMLGGDLRGCNVIETDTRLNGCWNGSVQYNQQSGFQVTDAKGNWVSIGFYPPSPLVANKLYDVRIAYDFDVPNKVTSIKTISLNDVVTPVPPNLQKVSLLGDEWTPGLYFQVQLGSMPSAEPWCLKLKKAEYVWS